jgi:nitrous oxidase accessory protein
MNRRKLFISIVFLIASAATALGGTLSVGAGGDFQTISSAVAAAAPGDVILISGGRFTENITLDKPLTLTGSAGAAIAGAGPGSVITIIADGCTIRGLALSHSGSDLRAEDAGILVRSNSNTIENNRLTDVLFGIYLLSAARNVIRGNTIVGRADLEVGERGAGLHLWNSPDNRLDNNTISFTRDGMYVQNSPRNVMNGNDVSQLRFGLHFMTSDYNCFESNVFHYNVAGAAIMYSEGIELRGNAFVHNRGFSSFGILFQDCRKCVTEGNVIANNATGVFLEALRDSVFRENTISDNDVAAQIFSSSENNVFTRNNFVNNISPLQMIGKSTSTAWSDGVAGNYWSDYDGYDLDGDSVGDVPFKIQNVFEYLEGNFPRLRIYLNSPAARSIVAAERSFPIIQASKQIDPRPLMRPVDTRDIRDLDRSVPKRTYLMTGVSLLALAGSLFIFWRSAKG